MTIEKFQLVLEQKGDLLSTALNNLRNMNNVEAIATVCYSDWPVWTDHR
jgi:hypothetical protein